MNSKIIWIFGSSAAGKGTLLRQLTDSNNKKLINHFSLKGYTVVGLKESTEWIMQYTDDPIVENRKEFPSLIDKLIKPKTAILIKGQDIDLTHNMPTILQNKYPSLSHEIIFLTIPLDEIYRRCKQKTWWEEGIDSKDTLLEWLKEQMSELAKLKGFKIAAYNSSTNQYQKTFFPPEL